LARKSKRITRDFPFQNGKEVDFVLVIENAGILGNIFRLPDNFTESEKLL
jgi:hypothetical protein